MSWSLRCSCALLLPFCLVGRVEAQGATDQAIAEALFQEGRKLVDERRYAEACPKFAESQRLDPGIGTLLNLATCHELEGKVASAWAEFTQALGLATREARASAQQLARTHLDAITPKLPKIVLTVPAENDVAGLEVRLDGQVIGKAAWGTAAPIDPGPHTVSASAPGKKGWSSEVTFAPAEPKTVSVPLLDPEATPTPPGQHVEAASTPVIPTVRSDDHADVGQRTVGLVVGGVGIAIMGTGVVLGLAAKSTYNESSGWCDASGGCEPQGLDLRESASRRGNVATIVFGIGAAATIAGGALWLTAPTKGRAPAVAVSWDRIIVRGTW